MSGQPARHASPLAGALDAGLEGLGISLEPRARRQLLDYVALLSRWNRAYNLTAVRDPREMVTRHVLDCLTVVDWTREGRLLDVGTGAGLPGLIIAIARPDLACVLLDASAKKTRFCIQAAAEMGLGNVEVVQARVETYRGDRAYDTVVSRAVGSVAALLAEAGHLLAPHGAMLAMKGRLPADELADLPAAVAREVHALAVPGLAEPRHLVVLRPGPGD